MATICAVLTYLAVGKLSPFDAWRYVSPPHLDLHRTLDTTAGWVEAFDHHWHPVGRVPRDVRALRVPGRTIVEQRALPPFDSIVLRNSADVTVTIGDQPTVSVEADENLVGRVSTTVESGKLVVGWTGGASRLNVTLPHLRSLNVDGPGSTSLSGLRDPISIVVSGAGNVKASGNVESVDLVVNGPGHFELTQLHAKDAKIVLMGTGDAAVFATRKLSATVFGPGSVRYLGDPHVTQNVLGPGSIAPICTS